MMPSELKVAWIKMKGRKEATFDSGVTMQSLKEVLMTMDARTNGLRW